MDITGNENCVIIFGFRDDTQFAISNSEPRKIVKGYACYTYLENNESIFFSDNGVYSEQCSSIWGWNSNTNEIFKIWQ